MERYWILRDGKIIAAEPTREEAIETIRIKQAKETHFIKSEFSIIKGEQEIIPYKYRKESL